MVAVGGYKSEEKGDFRGFYPEIGTRRLMKESETQLAPSHFAQTIDIDIYLPGKETKELPNMSGYPVRSVENSIDYIHELKAAGIDKVVLRMGGKPNVKIKSTYTFDPLFIGAKEDMGSDQQAASIDRSLHEHAEVIKVLRSYFPKGSLHITADPFGIAPNGDGSWGIQNDAGQLDYPRTFELIAKIASTYGNAGVDAIFSLGRINGEVAISRAALARDGLDVQIKSFSQNIESKSAYVYLNYFETHQDTGQKILPGNLTEMMLRTITDVYEGTSTISVKPTDHLHLISLTATMLRDPRVLEDFLTRPQVHQILDKNQEIRTKVLDVLRNPDEFVIKCSQVGIGTYTVSGLYYMHKLLERERGERFAFCVVDELYKNVVSAAGDKFDSIIDRNALWFVQALAGEWMEKVA